MKILVTGATGLIWEILSSKTKENGRNCNFDQKNGKNLMNFNGIQIKIS